MTHLGRFARMGEPNPKVSVTGPDAASPSAVEGRFTDLSPSPGGMPMTVTSGGTTDRFRRGASRESIPLAVEGDEQPFVRCVHCHADSHRHSPDCRVCGATFDSAEQRRYNEDLWPVMREEAHAAREALRQRREEQERRWHESIEAGRRRAEAREKTWEEDETLEGWLRRRRPSLGLRLLRRIPDPRARLAAIFAILGVFVFVWSRPDMNGRAWLLSFTLALLFLPRSGKGRGE